MYYNADGSDDNSTIQKALILTGEDISGNPYYGYSVVITDNYFIVGAYGYEYDSTVRSME